MAAKPLTDFWFDPTRLTAAVKNANVASFQLAKTDAQARRHNKSRSDVALKVISPEHGQLQPRGLQGVFEKGREGGYPINPGAITGLRKSRAGGTTTYRVRAGSGNATVLAGPMLDHPLPYTTGGPMRAYPAMQPAAVDWARKGYSATSKRVLLAQGFGVNVR